ncbi:MAG: TetR/AcrR family transcriptional regulator [Acidimicrobiales bacterium]
MQRQPTPHSATAPTPTPSGSSVAPSPRVARILAAAEALVQGGGVDAATIRSIAERAEVSPSTIYNLFGSRDAVLDALSDSVLEEFDFRSVTATGTAFGRVVELVGSLVDFVDARSALFRPLAADRRVAALAWEGPRRRRAMDIARLNLEIGVAAGELRGDVCVDTVARLVLDIWEHNQSRWAIGEIDVDEFRRRVVDEMAVVLAGVATAVGRAALEPHLPTRGTTS